MRVVLHVVVTAVAVWISLVVPGIELPTGSNIERVTTLLAVGLIFGLVNLVLKPIAKTLGCVLYVLTLGLFGLVVNALLYWLTGRLAVELDLPFAVDGFWPAFWGAIIVSVVSAVLQGVLRVDGDRRRRPAPRQVDPRRQGGHQQGPYQQGPRQQGPYQQGPYQQGPYDDGRY